MWLTSFVARGGQSKAATSDETADQDVVNVPQFDADSAYYFVKTQVDFGPRAMNTAAHDACGDYLANKLAQYGAKVYNQRADIPSYEGKMLKARNIIGAFNPEAKRRVALFAHWDSRPWADNDPDESNWKTPVMAANDGASGVGVMLEIARLLSADTLRLGVDFICFDAEDWGVPQWSDADEYGNSWALGSQYWSANLHKKGYKARFGILLDMVGGQGAQFYKEGMSVQYANSVVDKVWRAAQVVGYGSMFPTQLGPGITDDHLPVNTKAKIPTIDIIPYYPNCEQSGFGPTWHTVNDDMAHLDKNTLQAVGQTLIQVIFSEK